MNRGVKVMEGLIHNLVKISGILMSETKRLLYTVVADRLGLMGKMKGDNFKEKKPRWKRRTEKSIMDWRMDLSRVEKTGK